MHHLIMIIFLLVAALGGCHRTPVARSAITAEALQGDWVTTPFPWIRGNSTRLVFSFEDSLCSYMSPWGNYVRYELHRDTLVIFDREAVTDVPYQLRYVITGLTTDELRMVALPGKAKDWLARYQWSGDTIVLRRTPARNQLVPTRIVFDSSPCFGTCPILMLEIDSARQVTFLGTGYTKHKGGFAGRLSAGQYARLLNQITALPLDLKERYTAPWTDDQTCRVKIEYEGGELSSSAYGFNEEPIALRILLHKLLALENMVPLEADSTVKAYLKW